MKRECCPEATATTKVRMNDKLEKTLVRTNALKATPVSRPMNSLIEPKRTVTRFETPSRSWKFQNYEERNLTRMKGSEAREKSLWTWFGLDLILNGRIDDLERDWLSPYGRDWLSAPRLLQDLTNIDFVRWLMNINQICECTYGDASHSWCMWPHSRFREFIWMTNWQPRLGVLMKLWTSILTVESQLCRDTG